jgi:hypothetical protein
MNFEKTQITLYDPQARELDLVHELAPFFECNQTWKNSSITGSYLSCAQYFINQRLENLGLMCITPPEKIHSVGPNYFELILCCGMAVDKGYRFPDSELALLRELTSKSQMIVSPNLPDLPMYDSVREQFNATRRALDCFK